MPLHAICRPSKTAIGGDAVPPSTEQNILVVFVHGLDSSSHTWLATLANLERLSSIACLAVDQRGCGRSPLGDPADFSQATLVQDLHECIQQYCESCRSEKSSLPPRLVLVGHSLGGRIVLAYAATHPQNVSVVIVEDMDITIRSPVANGIIQLKTYDGVFSQHYPTQTDAVQALLDVGYPQTFVEKTLATGRLQQLEDGTWWSHVNPDFRKLCYPHILSTSHGKSDCETLASASSSNRKIPVHVFVADQEYTVCSEEGLREMQEIFEKDDQLTIHRFPTAKHSIHSTVPEQFITELNNIIRTAKNESPTDALQHLPSTILVLVLCGLPGAGKSTVAKAFMEALKPIPLHMVEYDGLEDSLLDDVGGASSTEARLEAWRQSRKVALEKLRHLLTSPAVEGVSRVQSHLGTTPFEQVILMDDNFYLRSMRKQIFITCQEEQTALMAKKNTRVALASVWLDTPLSLCRTRNAERARQVPEHVLERMGQSMEAPIPVKTILSSDFIDKNTSFTNDDEQNRYKTATSRPHWESVVWQLDGTQPVDGNVAVLVEHLRNVVAWLPQALIPPPVDPAIEEQRLATERAKTSRSVGHQIDVALRQAVKTVMCSNVTRSNRQQIAPLANNARKQVLSENIPDERQALQRFTHLFLSQTDLEEHTQEELRQALIKTIT